MSTEESILFYAFRYALGRMTYAVNEVANVIIDRSKRGLSEEFRRLVVAEIVQAEARNALGMACDAEDWQRVRTALQSTVNA